VRGARQVSRRRAFSVAQEQRKRRWQQLWTSGGAAGLYRCSCKTLAASAVAGQARHRGVASLVFSDAALPLQPPSTTSLPPSCTFPVLLNYILLYLRNCSRLLWLLCWQAPLAVRSAAARRLRLHTTSPHSCGTVYPRLHLRQRHEEKTAVRAATTCRCVAAVRSRHHGRMR